MITIVNLNPCIDWQYNIPKFTYGGMNRVRRTYESAASKGTNVAIALKNLGLTPTCIGINFADGGDKVREKFDSHGIPHDFETVEGAVRVNIKVFEEETGIMTELNQPGSFVPEVYVHNLKNKVARLSTADGILVLTGSLPAGVPENIYAELTALWHGKVFLDADGGVLRQALSGEVKPYAVKPNLFELENAFGIKLPIKYVGMPYMTSKKCPSTSADTIHRVPTKNNLAEKGLTHNLHGIPIACISMGADGAILLTPDAAYFSPALDIEARGIQGAGDAMVAGLILATLQNLPPPEMLCYAMAAAAASVIMPGTEMCTRRGFEAMLEKIPPPEVL